MSIEFLDLRKLIGPTRDLRTDPERWRYEKKLRYAQRQLEERKAQRETLLFPFRRQAV